MVIIALVTWWYTAGWARLGRLAASRTMGTFDFFSVGMLAGSLFAPFRQISVGRVRGSFEVQARAWVDKQISRGIGAMVRLSVIVFGLIATALTLAVAVTLLILWPFVPLAPLIVGIIIWSMA